MNVGPQDPSDCLPCLSRTLPLSVRPRRHESCPPQLPVSAPPTSLDECLFFIALVSDFLAVRFSASSCCVRRRSVSTYAAILVLSDPNILNHYPRLPSINLLLLQIFVLILQDIRIFLIYSAFLALRNSCYLAQMLWSLCRPASSISIIIIF